MQPMGRHREGSGWIFITIAVMVTAVFGGLAGVSRQLGPASIPIWFAAMIVGAVVLRGPLGQALAKRVSGDAGSTPEQLEVPPELYGELDELRARLGELEERVDFSERLLARRDGDAQ